MTAVDTFYPFDTGSGASATVSRWRAMARQFYPSGVIPGYANQLRTTLSGTVVTVQTGAAFIDGFYGEVTSAKTMTISGNGQVVARMDPVARTIALYFVAGQSTPTQNPGGIFEIPLLQVTGAVGTDIRQWSSMAQPAAVARGRVWRNAPWTTSTTVFTFGFDTVSYGSGFSGAGGSPVDIYTCPYSADYLAIVQMGFLGTAVGQWYQIYLMQNNVQIAGANATVAAPNGDYWARASDIIPCKAGDTISVTHQSQVSGLTGLYGHSSWSFMSVHALS